MVRKNISVAQNEGFYIYWGIQWGVQGPLILQRGGNGGHHVDLTYQLNHLHHFWCSGSTSTHHRDGLLYGELLLWKYLSPAFRDHSYIVPRIIFKLYFDHRFRGFSWCSFHLCRLLPLHIIFSIFNIFSKMMWFTHGWEMGHKSDHTLFGLVLLKLLFP